MPRYYRQVGDHGAVGFGFIGSLFAMAAFLVWALIALICAVAYAATVTAGFLYDEYRRWQVRRRTAR
jgi:hypothetical protein